MLYTLPATPTQGALEAEGTTGVVGMVGIAGVAAVPTFGVSAAAPSAAVVAAGIGSGFLKGSSQR